MRSSRPSAHTTEPRTSSRAREAVSEALTELLDQFPDADLLDLTTEQREYALEKFVANDVFKRFELDVGKQVYGKAPSAALGLKRMQEVKEYMAEVVGTAFRASSPPEPS